MRCGWGDAEWVVAMTTQCPTAAAAAVLLAPTTLPAACCLLPDASCMLPAACCLLPAACCLLRTVHAALLLLRCPRFLQLGLAPGGEHKGLGVLLAGLQHGKTTQQQGTRHTLYAIPQPAQVSTIRSAAKRRAASRAETHASSAALASWPSCPPPDPFPGLPVHQ